MATVRWALLALVASGGLGACVTPYVYLGELAGQPNEAQLGRYVAVDATSDDAAQVRLRARGGTLAALNGQLSDAPVCLPLIDGELDAVVQVKPANVEASVTAELVAAAEDCAAATSAGPAAVLVVRDGGGSTSSSTGTGDAGTTGTGSMSGSSSSGTGTGGTSGAGGAQ